MEKYHATKATYEENCDTFIVNWKDSNIVNNGKIQAFIALIAPNSKILDIGAGFGKDINYFCDKGFDSIGIDFCDSFIEKSKELYNNVKILKMNFLDIDFPENSFDALWARGTLFHISKQDFLEVLRSLKNILKPNGIFYIQLIEGSNDGMLTKIGEVDSPAYYSYYTADELKEIMSRYGFQYIKEYPVKGWLNHYYKLTK